MINIAIEYWSTIKRSCLHHKHLKKNEDISCYANLQKKDDISNAISNEFIQLYRLDSLWFWTVLDERLNIMYTHVFYSSDYIIIISRACPYHYFTSTNVRQGSRMKDIEWKRNNNDDQVLGMENEEGRWKSRVSRVSPFDLAPR